MGIEKWGTLGEFVVLSSPLDMGLDSFNCLFLGVESNITGGVIQPLDSEMCISLEVIPYGLIGHIVNSKEVPGIVPDLDIILSEIDIVLLVKVTLK